MQDVQLVPMTQEQKEVLNIGKPHKGDPLTDEVTTLRGAFHLAAQCPASTARTMESERRQRRPM